MAVNDNQFDGLSQYHTNGHCKLQVHEVTVMKTEIKEEMCDFDITDIREETNEFEAINNVKFVDTSKYSLSSHSKNEEKTFAIHTEKKLKRKSITLEEKNKILNKLKSGTRVASIAKELNLHESTIRTIRQNESKIRAIMPSASIVSSYRVARIKDTLLAKMENCLIIWIEDCCLKRIPLNNTSIRQKAIKIYQYLKETGCISSNIFRKSEFKASSGWFHKFKKRFDLRNVKLAGESTSADIEAADRFRIRFSKIIEEENYLAEQVYNADEFVLYWKKMPERTYISDLKTSKERITLLFCSNAAGEHIVKPMLINQCLTPLQDIENAKLPVHLQTNERGTITGAIFSNWFYNYFIPEVKEYLQRKNISFKILLLMDKMPGRPINLDHPNVEVIFLPPNTASLIQPLDQGIIKTFKTCYIRRTFEMILRKTNSSSNKTILQIWRSFSIINCIEIISASLNELKSSTLNACWKQLWPNVVVPNFSTSTEIDVNCVITIAQDLGREGFTDINEEDITELVNYNEDLGEAELIELTNCCDSGNDGERLFKASDEPKDHLTLEALNKGFEIAKKLERHFIRIDPSTDRSIAFKTKLLQCLSPYYEAKYNLEKDLFLNGDNNEDNSLYSSGDDLCSNTEGDL